MDDRNSFNEREALKNDVIKKIKDYRKGKNIDLTKKLEWVELGSIFGEEKKDIMNRIGVSNLTYFWGNVKNADSDISMALKEKNERESEEKYLKNMAKAAEKKAREDAYKDKMKLADATRHGRRLETVARLLETEDNVCVAIVEIEGKLYAATNKGDIGRFSFEDKKLKVVPDSRTEENLERKMEKNLLKVEDYIEKTNSIPILNINQVGKGYKFNDNPNNIHAEMKLLDYCFYKGIQKAEFFISRKCCANCRDFIIKWNFAGLSPKVTVREESSCVRFDGWQAPKCSSVLDEKLADESTKRTTKSYKRNDKGWDINDTLVRPQRRDKSSSPSPSPSPNRK